MAIPLEITLDRPGRTPYRLTPNLNTLNFTTVAVGGFGSCSFDLPGPPPFWKRELPHLAILRVVMDTFVIWEGRLEDIRVSLRDESTTVTCFGLQRLLDLKSVRRVWSKRDIQWGEPSVPRGSAANASKTRTATELITASAGNFDPTDLTKSGTQFSGTGGTVANQNGEWLEWIPPSGITLILWLGTQTASGTDSGSTKWAANWTALESGTWTEKATSATGGTANFSVSLSSATGIRIGVTQSSGAPVALNVNDRMQHYDMRLLGTSLTEDTSGGFYGGTILNDLIALVPGLQAGIIDAGSDYTIQAIERSVRDTARSVVNEVAGYYTREWRVWEDGRFDWKAVNMDEPQWVARVNDLSSGSELTTTIDGVANTLYVLYDDAASGLGAEQSASATSQRNPFVKQGKTSDSLVEPGFAMTSSSASQLASKLVGDTGSYPLVEGRLVLPATNVIKRAAGSPLPAFQIRGGDNIIVADLPKTDLFSQGRDGETLFHIVSTETDLESGTVTLEVEGQTKRSDVLLARLAAVTRTLTG